jgi:glyoxylase-like metal-dependent hydrolase (beta-lactamase superfamily II)
MNRDAGLSFPFDAPAHGAAVAVAPSALWARAPLPMKLDHVNLYAFDDGDGWTLVDAGLAWGRGREALAALRAGPLKGGPVRRVIVTHHHPDHMGLAADLIADGAELWTTRTAWLFARMLTLDHEDRPRPETLRFLRRAGWGEDRLAAHAAQEPFNFSRVVAPLPRGFRRIADGDRLEMGGRMWRVVCGGGHAPEHATLWSEDGALAVTGDQILPRISPNIGVYATEPEADPLADWFESCARLGRLADDERLALPGHGRPFRGLSARLAQHAENHVAALGRLRARLAEGPATAVEAFGAVFGRGIGEGEYGLATAEAVAHVNRLAALGEAVGEDGPDGARRFRLGRAPDP